jgi:hypothetical protein
MWLYLLWDKREELLLPPPWQTSICRGYKSSLGWSIVIVRVYQSFKSFLNKFLLIGSSYITCFNYFLIIFIGVRVFVLDQLFGLVMGQSLGINLFLVGFVFESLNNGQGIGRF